MISLSDDSVEAAARALYDNDKADAAIFSYTLEDLPGQHNLRLKKAARAAITAYLQAEIKAGGARIAGRVVRNEVWNAFEGNHVDGTPQCLILSLEPSK